MQDNEHKRLVEMIDGYKGKEGSLSQLLLDLQSEFNDLKDTLQRYPRGLKIHAAVYTGLKFYEAMSHRPIGNHTVSVCMGTAFQVRGSE